MIIGGPGRYDEPGPSVCVGLAMDLTELGVGTGVVEHSLALLVAQLATHLARHAGDERTPRHFGAFQDDGSGRDERSLADHGAVQQYGPHADETVVCDDSAVDDGAMPDGDARTDADREADVGVRDDTVLQVAVDA